ncbi:MAG: LPS export ABC transporter periplasmic protein LptC [Elusimicrobia bacterium CG08_land_8_20_14_0_20_59_10]|nr:MAG: LPS export ABC transporter periplasmic protein LptC [Elusimicrobia bacterium CG08_land_8_20_14_0_20_59_10]
MRPFAVLFAAVFCACSAPKTPDAAPGTSLINGFTMAEVNAGPSRWRLNAKTARMLEKQGLILFTSPEIRFYDGKIMSSEIKARDGKLLMREKETELTGDVRVDSRKDGMKLLTSKLFFSTARDKIWTDEPVTIYRERTVITGRGFTANPDLSEIELLHQETRLAR